MDDAACVDGASEGACRRRAGAAPAAGRRRGFEDDDIPK